MGLHTLLLALQIAAPDSARLAAIARFHPGTTLRLQGPAIGLVEARLRSPAGDTITVGRWQPERRIPLAVVDSIWVQHTRTTEVGVGGAVWGAVALGGLAWGFSGMCESSSGCGGERARAVLWGALAGVAIGGTLGAALGSADRRWERIYP
jgi:hypothetical protein